MDKKILILYYELADYVLNCAVSLSVKAEVHIVHYEVNSEAPFELDGYPGLNLYKAGDLSFEALKQLKESINPDLILVSGWADSKYNKLISMASKDDQVVLMFDTAEDYSLVQSLKASVFRLTKKRNYNFCFVPGVKQRKLAKKLGFRDSEIKLGAYAANVKLFQPEIREGKIPSRFIYVGRYIERKGIFDLWNAFKKYRENGGSWELICIGAGEEWPNRMEYEGMVHEGFVQPKELKSILEKASVYILPSHFEPWGVSVQEMAANGKVLVLSDQVNSAEIFLEEEENGFAFEPKNVTALSRLMTKIESKSEEELKKMSAKSVVLGKKYSVSDWVESVIDFAER